MKIEIETTGFILYTRNYEGCKLFYKDVLGFPVLYEKDDLICFEFGASYLMVELGDKLHIKESKEKRDLSCLRMNVLDVKGSCQILDEAEVEYEYNEFDWGTIAKFRDPDGNLIAFRSSKEHIEDQINSTSKN